MIVIPAIDIRRGRCVRLVQGRPEEETVFSDDPLAVARRWTREGAQRLHVVNLDGAFSSDANRDAAAANSRTVADLVTSSDVPIQLGGGLRSMADIERAMSLGVDRVILGTAAVERPGMVAQAVRRWDAERIIVGIDGRNGVAVTRGWLHESSIPVLDLALRMKSLGVARIVYTDVRRDGMLEGPNLEAIAGMAQRSGLRVIASGGVRSLADIEALLPLERDGVEAVIVGRALYTGTLDLSQAMQVCRRTTVENQDIQEV
jgi:phosphoribosylformimino-5-aminoimidazole carboxamide ribotide isomerase